MVELVREKKVYSEFLTNLAVAWFSGGVITPVIVRPKTIQELLVFSLLGILGTIFSLRAASLIARGGK